MTGDEMTAKQIAKALGLDAKTPVLPCHLRDRESVASVVQRGAGAGGGEPRRLRRRPAPPPLIPVPYNAAPRLSSPPRGAKIDRRRRAAPGPARRKDTTACTTPATA